MPKDLSLLSLMVFYLAVYKEEKKYWIILPFLMGFAFLSMQLPSGIINLLILKQFTVLRISVISLRYLFLEQNVTHVCIVVLFKSIACRNF